MPSVLIVDDDPQVRHFLKRSFEGAGWKVYQAGDAQSALQALQSKTRVHAVITDIRMPGPSGIILLGALQKIGVDEHIPIVVVSGSASQEEEALLSSLQPVAYFRKPVDAKQLLEALARYVDNPNEIRTRKTSQRVAGPGAANQHDGKFESIEKTIELASQCLTIPAILERLTAAIESQSSSADDIAAIARHDPALTSRMLRLVNSSFYGPTESIIDLKAAVVRLGFDTVKNLFLTAELFTHLRSSGSKLGNLDKEKLWLHSISVAVLARRIALNSKRTSEAETYFVAGILHDVGKFLLHEYANEDYQRVCSHAQTMPCSLYEGERALLHVTHCAVGDAFLRQWGIPVAIRELVANHHKSAHQLKRAVDLSDVRGIALLQIADLYANLLGLGSSGHNGITNIDATLLDVAGISKSDIQDAVAAFHGDLLLALDFLGAKAMQRHVDALPSQKTGTAVIAGFDPTTGICACSVYLSSLGYRVLHISDPVELPRALSTSKPKVVVIYEKNVPTGDRETLLDLIALAGSVERCALVSDAAPAKPPARAVASGVQMFATSLGQTMSARIFAD